MKDNPNLEKQERTKRSLQDAFIQLYKKSPLEKITISQITAAAGVTRSTYYVYYDSIYAILEAIESELRDGLGTYFEEYSSGVLEEKSLEPYDSNLRWFEYCREHSEYLSVLLGPRGDPSFEYKLRKQLKKDINRMMDRDGMVNDYLRKYVVEYVAGATLSLTRFWLENREGMDAKDIAVVANLIRLSKVMPDNGNGGK